MSACSRSTNFEVSLPSTEALLGRMVTAPSATSSLSRMGALFAPQLSEPTNLKWPVRFALLAASSTCLHQTDREIIRNCRINEKKHFIIIDFFVLLIYVHLFLVLDWIISQCRWVSLSFKQTINLCVNWLSYLVSITYGVVMMKFMVFLNIYSCGK